MSSEPGLAVIEAFPEIQRLGQATIQRLCDAWIMTPLAREFAVSKLVVDDKLRLTFQFQVTHKVQDGEALYFPTDELLLYIVDNGFSGDVERDTVKRRIVAARERGGPDVFRRLKVQAGPKLPQFLTCKKCGNVMQTQVTAFRSEKSRFEPEEIECPRCHHVFTIDGRELHFEPDYRDDF